VKENMAIDVATGTQSRAPYGKVWRGRLTLLLLCLQMHVGTAAGSVGSVIKTKFTKARVLNRHSIGFAKQTLQSGDMSST
jgi:hypothetical protein